MKKNFKPIAQNTWNRRFLDRTETLTIRLTPELSERWDRMLTRMGAKDSAEAARLAFALADLVYEAADDDLATLHLHLPDGRTREILLGTKPPRSDSGSEVLPAPVEEASDGGQ